MPFFDGKMAASGDHHDEAVEGTNTVSGNLNGIIPFSITSAFRHNQVNTGWVAAYSTEGVIDFWGARNWSWKIEGLYMDLVHLDATGSAGSFTITSGGVTTVVTGGQISTHSHFTDGILRAGLKFY